MFIDNEDLRNEAEVVQERIRIDGGGHQLGTAPNHAWHFNDKDEYAIPNMSTNIRPPRD